VYDDDGNLVTMLTTAQTAAYLGVSTDCLKMWRRNKVQRGPRYFRLEKNLVRYRREDLDSFVAKRTVNPMTGGDCVDRVAELTTAIRTLVEALVMQQKLTRDWGRRLASIEESVKRIEEDK
jgi:hypothetical protein